MPYFFYLLTFGVGPLKFVQDGKYTEVELHAQIGKFKQTATRRVWADEKPIDPATKVEPLSVGQALDDGFVGKALAELSAQKIYSSTPLQVNQPRSEMMHFVNSLIGADFFVADFLRGYSPNYIKHFGRKIFDSFYEACERFQSKYDRDKNLDISLDEDYKQAQDLIVDTILEKISEDAKLCKPNEFARIMAIIKHCALSLEETICMLTMLCKATLRHKAYRNELQLHCDN